MAVTSNIVKQFLLGNGTILTFHFTVPFVESSALHMYLKMKEGNIVPLTNIQDYTLNLLGPNLEEIILILGGTSVLTAAPRIEDELWMVRESDFVQDYYDLTSTTPWVPLQTEEAFDRQQLQIQELKEITDRAITVNVVGNTEPLQFPPPEPDAYIKWDSEGEILVNSTVNVEAFEYRIAALETAVIDIYNTLTQHSNSINQIGTELSNLQQSIAAINAELDQIQIVLNDHGNRITAIEINGGGGGGGPTTPEIEDIKADIAELQSDVAALEAEQIVQNQRLESLEARVSTIENTYITYRRTGTYPIHNDQTIPFDTNISFGADYTMASRVFLYLHRKDSLETRISTYIFVLQFYVDHWNMSLESKTVTEGNDDGVYFSLRQIPAEKAAVIQYISDEMVGTYDVANSQIRWETDDFVVGGV